MQFHFLLMFSVELNLNTVFHISFREQVSFSKRAFRKYFNIYFGYEKNSKIFNKIIDKINTKTQQTRQLQELGY